VSGNDPARAEAARRRAQLAANLDAVRARIGAVARASGRDPAEIRLIAVTKTFPVSDLAHLAAIGVTDFGENRATELAAKATACAELGLTGLHPHFVGQLQTNKVDTVVAHARVVHSVDRARLVDALARAVRQQRRELDVLVQVDLDRDTAPDAPTGRGGARPADLAGLCSAIAQTAGLRLRGVMAVAPLGVDAHMAFEDLARFAAAVRADHPDATWISAGMSADLEVAISHGATHVRVGSHLLGGRPRNR